MSLPSNLAILVPPSLPPAYCPLSWQQLVNDLIGGTQLTFLIGSGNFLYNYGASTPAPENRIFPWLSTSNGLWWTFQGGVWTSPHPVPPGPDGRRQLFVGPEDGSATGVWKLDGGDGTDPRVSGNVTQYLGAFWQVDHVGDGRSAIGPGAVPNSTPALNINPGDVGGEAQHTLLLKEIPFHDHSMSPLGTEVDPNAPFINVATFQAGPDWSSNTTGGNLRAAGFQPQGGDPANNNATVAHNNLPPYYGVYLIARTARQFYTLPG